MYYVLARSALLLTGAGGVYFYATTGDVPLWFMGLAAIAQIIFFIVKRNFRANGEEQFRARVARKYDGDDGATAGSLEERMLAAAETYKRSTGQ